MRLRENAESIAFYGGEAQEATQVATRLGGAIDNRRRILGTQRNLEFFTVGYTYLIPNPNPNPNPNLNPNPNPNPTSHRPPPPPESPPSHESPFLWPTPPRAHAALPGH